MLKSILKMSLIAFLISAGPVAYAQEPQPSAVVAAAASLAENGIAHEDASLIISALEILRSFRLKGAKSEEIQNRFVTSAVFFSRGDLVLKDRLGALAAAPDDNAAQVWVAPLLPTLNVPKNVSAKALSVTSSARLVSVQKMGQSVCMRAKNGWMCDPNLAHGTLQIEFLGASEALVAFEVVESRE